MIIVNLHAFYKGGKTVNQQKAEYLTLLILESFSMKNLVAFSMEQEIRIWQCDISKQPVIGCGKYGIPFIRSIIPEVSRPTIHIRMKVISELALKFRDEDSQGRRDIELLIMKLVYEQIFDQLKYIHFPGLEISLLDRDKSKKIFLNFNSKKLTEGYNNAKH